MSVLLQKRATISDVARMAGVSITTVSRVINANAPVAAETVARVRDAIAFLDYTPSPVARSLAGHHTNTIGLYLPGFSGGFFATMFQGVEAGVREAGYDLLIHVHPQLALGEAPSNLPLGGDNTDGVIIFTNSVPDEAIVNLAQHGLPLVLLFRSAPAGINAPSVRMENQNSVEQLVGHLVQVHGRRRIAFLRGPVNNEDSEQREAAYRSALAAHGLVFDPELVGRGDFLADRACAAVRAWLEQGVEFDGLFAGDDDSALGALRALREAGRRVPEDVSLVGYDDVSVASLVVPALTTVHVPIAEAGQIAARQLVNLIRTGQAGDRYVLPTEVVIRQSCGCP